MKRIGDFFFRFRNAIFPVVGLGVFFFSKPATFPQDSSLNLALARTGIFLAVLGQSFRMLVIGHDPIVRGGKEGKVHAERLVTGGFYACCRNPLYVGNMLIVMGLSLTLGSVLAYAFVLPFFVFVYGTIILAEETYLKKHFGQEYENYAKNVPRFWPHFRRLKGSLQGRTYHWRKAIRTDYGQIFTTLLMIILITFWRSHSLHGHWSPGEEKRLATSLILLLLFYVITRYLKKKTHLLDSTSLPAPQ